MSGRDSPVTPYIEVPAETSSLSDNEMGSTGGRPLMIWSDVGGTEDNMGRLPPTAGAAAEVASRLSGLLDRLNNASVARATSIEESHARQRQLQEERRKLEAQLPTFSEDQVPSSPRGGDESSAELAKRISSHQAHDRSNVSSHQRPLLPADDGPSSPVHINDGNTHGGHWMQFKQSDKLDLFLSPTAAKDESKIVSGSSPRSWWSLPNEGVSVRVDEETLPVESAEELNILDGKVQEYVGSIEHHGDKGSIKIADVEQGTPSVERRVNFSKDHEEHLRALLLDARQRKTVGEGGSVGIEVQSVLPTEFSCTISLPSGWKYCYMSLHKRGNESEDWAQALYLAGNARMQRLALHSLTADTHYLLRVIMKGLIGAAPEKNPDLNYSLCTPDTAKSSADARIIFSSVSRADAEISDEALEYDDSLEGQYLFSHTERAAHRCQVDSIERMLKSVGVVEGVSASEAADSDDSNESLLAIAMQQISDLTEHLKREEHRADAAENELRAHREASLGLRIRAATAEARAAAATAASSIASATNSGDTVNSHDTGAAELQELSKELVTIGICADAQISSGLISLSGEVLGYSTRRDSVVRLGYLGGRCEVAIRCFHSVSITHEDEGALGLKLSLGKSLQHPYIISILGGVAKARHPLQVVMPLKHGITLKELLNLASNLRGSSNALCLRDACHIAMCCLAALQYMHTSSVVAATLDGKFEASDVFVTPDLDALLSLPGPPSPVTGTISGCWCWNEEVTQQGGQLGWDDSSTCIDNSKQLRLKSDVIALQNVLKDVFKVVENAPSTLMSALESEDASLDSLMSAIKSTEAAMLSDKTIRKVLKRGSRQEWVLE